MCTPNPRARALARRLSPACALAGLLAAAPARAEPPATPEAVPATASSAPPAASSAPPAASFDPLDPGRRVDATLRLFGSFEVGRGFRFNNPFRLSTQLGSTAKSVSLTASYADLGFAVAYGPPDGLQHGASLHASFALAGVQQAVLTPSYLLAYRGPNPFLAYGRVGPSIVLTPDPTMGVEIAGGFAWFLTGKIAVAGEIVFDLYYGAGTYDVGIASYPILSGQLGLLVDHELLP